MLQSMMLQVREIKRRFITEERGDYTAAFILIAVGLVVGAFVVIPSLRTFAGTVFTGLTNWWSGTISSKLFPTT